MERVNFKRDFMRMLEQISEIKDMGLIEQMLQDRVEEINRLKIEIAALTAYKKRNI